MSAPKADDRTVYPYCRDSKVSAKGFVSSGEFTVLVGSIVSNHTAPSLETRGKTYYNLRNTLTKDGIIADGMFTKDYEFRAPSAASAVILGHTSNGKAEWKTKCVVKLGEID